MVVTAFLATVLGPFLASYLYASYLFGGTQVRAVCKLFWLGRFSYDSLSACEWAVEGFKLRDFSDRCIYSAKRIQVVRASWRAIKIEVSGPYVNLLADESGLQYVIALLQRVGYLEEERSAEPPIKQDFPTPVETAVGSAKTKMSGEISASILQIALIDGTMEVPSDFREILGAYVTVKMAAGTSSVKALSLAMLEHTAQSEISDTATSLPDSWWQTPPERLLRTHPDHTSDSGQEVKSESSPSQTGSHADGGARTGSLSEAHLKQSNSRASADPSAAEQTPFKARYPVLFHFNSENVASTVRGWRTATGLLLAEPIKSQVHFSREIAKYALSRVHPILGMATSLEGTESIISTVTPLHMHLPCKMMSLRLEPLKVQLKTKKFVKGLVKLVKVVKRKSWEEADTLEAWTSAIAADVYRSGLIISKRMDLLIGHNVEKGDGLHLFMWGNLSYNSADAAVHMQMGIPCKTLTRLAFSNLDEDFTYYIAVKGTAQNPEIDWLRASKDLLEILAKSNLRSALPILKGLFRNPSEKHMKKQSVQPPPPTLPLPWQAFPEESVTTHSQVVEPDDSSVGQSSAAMSATTSARDSGDESVVGRSRSPVGIDWGRLLQGSVEKRQSPQQLDDLRSDFAGIFPAKAPSWAASRSSLQEPPERSSFEEELEDYVIHS